MGPDGCPDTSVFCRTPQTHYVDATGGAGSFQITTQDLAYIRELVATDESAAALVVQGLQIDSINIRGKNYLPNGPVIANAFAAEFQNYTLPALEKITASVPATVNYSFRPGTTTGIAQLTFWTDERR